MNTKNNQRAKDTRAKIESVFTSLLKDKELQKISIQEICRGADVNRTTFYIHYIDIYDLMRKMEEEMFQQIENLFIDKETGNYKAITVECFVGLFQFLKDNRDFYQAYLKSSGQNNMVYSSISESCKKALEPFFHEVEILSTREIEYHLEFFKAGISAIILYWLNADCLETPQELADIISREYNSRR